MNKEQILRIIARVAVKNKIDVYYDDDIDTSETELYNQLVLCDDLPYGISDINGIFEDEKVEIVLDENNGDGSQWQLVLKVTKGNDEGYIRFNGYYSSWDSSAFTSHNKVKPVEVKTTMYLTHQEAKQYN